VRESVGKGGVFDRCGFNPLKQRLIEVGVPAERILVNPNAVDPGSFQPQTAAARNYDRI